MKLFSRPRPLADVLLVNELNSNNERRVFHRFETQVPVTLLSESGKTLSGRAADVSLAGMLLRCDRETLQAVAPKFDKTTPDEAPTVTARFELGGDQANSIEVDCKVVLIRRFSQSEYYLHLQYEFFKGNGYNDLEDFIDAMTEIGATRPASA